MTPGASVVSVALQKLSKLRHGAVAFCVVSIGALGAVGVLGGGWHGERYDGWQVVVAPAGGDALRIREVYDQDFGTTPRHGHERTIPNDFGEPTDIVVSSPDAPDEVDIESRSRSTRIRIGDPDETITGQHRYVIEYTLPEAQLARGLLALDLIDEHEFDVARAEIVVIGFELDQAACFIGRRGATDRCAFTEAGGGYRAELVDLTAGTGVTVEGLIVASDPGADPSDVPVPPLPARRGDPSPLLGAGLGALGAAMALPIYLVAKRRGRNEVFSGGAVDAAFGHLPSPGSRLSPPLPSAPAGDTDDLERRVTLVSDDALGELATIEFVPPAGIDPWEAAVLLTERFGNDSVSNYLSGLAGMGVVSIDMVDDDLAIGRGPEWAQVTDPGEVEMLSRIWQLGDPYVVTGKYDKGFADAWDNIRAKLARRIATSGWWHRGTPASSSAGAGSAAAAMLLSIAVLLPIGLVIASAGGGGFLKRWPIAIGVAVLAPALAALAAYARLLPSRTATGSALTLQAESFRRFLAASEGRHVQWAWEHGRLREYSAWAVALGAADAWSRALAAADVPEPQVYMAPLMLHQHQSDLTGSRTVPSSSSSSGGGGFSGGSVGGGGGGGSSGSW